MDIQALVDAFSAQKRLKRSETQMALGEMIQTLSEMAPESLVANLRNPHSYRGYYSDLAFELEDGTRLASELLEDCKNAMGEVFEGYKGGDFLMGKITPVWVASYGCCGEELMSINADGSLETTEDD